MEPIHAFIVDDEEDAGNLVRDLLLDFTAVNVTHVFTAALSALDAAVAEQPAVVFLDINMPEITGIEFLKQLHRYSPATKVVFVSAYRQYALEALQNGAFDFIPKPVGKEELRRVLHKLLAARNSINGGAVPATQQVLLKTAEGHHYIALQNVLFLEAEGNYTQIHLTEDKSLFSSVNLGRIYSQLPQQQFIRISRRHIISKNYLKFMNFNKKQCTVAAGEKEYQLEVSVKLKELKEQL